MLKQASTSRSPRKREKNRSKHRTMFRSSHLMIIKDEGTSLQLHWVEYTCYSQVGKVAFSVWPEGALANAVNGSCLLNPVPSSFCCQVPWVNAGMETQPPFFFFFFTSRICFIYVIASNLKKDIFWRAGNQLGP